MPCLSRKAPLFYGGSRFLVEHDDPAKIALAMRIARRTLRIVHQNIVFALGIKALCLLLGALGIAGMWAAIFADVGVMVIAVLNATRALYTKDLRSP